MKSKKRVKTIDEIVKPFTIVFPVDIEGSVNGRQFRFLKGQKSFLTYSEYETIMHSLYAEYLSN